MELVAAPSELLARRRQPGWSQERAEIAEDADTVEIVPPLTLVFNLEYEILGRVIN